MPEIRADAAQRAQGAWLHGRGRADRIRQRGARCAGLDLLPLVVGSEGMLAVITEVTVKLVPKPKLARCIMASFDDVRKAGDAVASIIAEGIIPAGLEMLDKPMTAAVEDYVHAGYDLDAEAILLCESDGTPEEVAEEIARMRSVLNRCGATRVRGQQRRGAAPEILERTQERVPGAGRISPDYMCMDSTIPRKRLADILIAIAADGEEVRPALRQRLPCRRRQPAPADPVRRQRPRPAAPLRAVRRRHPGDQCRDGRHRHRRAWRRRREAQLDVRAVLARRARADGRRQARLRSRGHAEPGQGDSDAAALCRVRQDACQEGAAALP